MSPFTHPWILLGAIAAFGALFVVLPVAVGAFLRHRKPLVLDCPESGERAAVIVDARRAALTAAIGEPRLRVTLCSLWPERKDCGQTCLKKA